MHWDHRYWLLLLLVLVWQEAREFKKRKAANEFPRYLYPSAVTSLLICLVLLLLLVGRLSIGTGFVLLFLVIPIGLWVRRKVS